MKKLIVTFFLALIILPYTHGKEKEYKNLVVFVTDFFDSRASITVQALNHDPLIAVDVLKNALVMNGFKVISERVAKEKIELNNKGQVTDSTFNQDISASKTTYMKSIYVVTFSYQGRQDSGCGGSVMSNLSGQIVDLSNDGQIVATFSFKQGSLEGKCTSDVLLALAQKLKKNSKK